MDDKKYRIGFNCIKGTLALSACRDSSHVLAIWSPHGGVTG